MENKRKEELTVLLAVHNGASFIKPAIESILHQTYPFFRFLIIDDGSMDSTAQIVRSYSDPRIELFRLEQNRGQTAALNIGLHRATTPWIARMDQDDYSAPTRLEEQMRVLHQDKSLRCVGTFGWIFRYDPQVIDEILERPVDYEAMKQEILRGTPMLHPSIIIGRHALLEIGGYDERYRISADRDMYRRFLARHRAVNIPRPLYGARRHNRQGSFSRVAADETIEIFCRMLSEEPYTHKEKSVLRKTLSHSYLFHARCCQAEGRYSSIMRDLIEAFRVSPKATVEKLIETVFLRMGSWK